MGTVEEWGEKKSMRGNTVREASKNVWCLLQPVVQPNLPLLRRMGELTRAARVYGLELREKYRGLGPGPNCYLEGL